MSGAIRRAKRRQRADGPRHGAPKYGTWWKPTVSNARKAAPSLPSWQGRTDHRGPRAGHVCKGSPGTWEVPTLPQRTVWGSRECSCDTRVRGTATPLPSRVRNVGAWWGTAGGVNNERPRDGSREFRAPRSTVEAGEPARGTPGREGGGRTMEPLKGKTRECKVLKASPRDDNG